MLYVRLERSDAIYGMVPEGRVDSVSPWIILGPFEWVQMTYSELRSAPDGDPLAVLQDDGWWLTEPRSGDESVRGVAAREYPFSDVIVYGAA